MWRVIIIFFLCKVCKYFFALKMFNIFVIVVLIIWIKLSEQMLNSPGLFVFLVMQSNWVVWQFMLHIKINKQQWHGYERKADHFRWTRWTSQLILVRRSWSSPYKIADVHMALLAPPIGEVPHDLSNRKWGTAVKSAASTRSAGRWGRSRGTFPEPNSTLRHKSLVC